MSRFIDFDQPIFFTPPSGKESGPRRLFKGGGGGSSGTPYYAQQDRLFGTQADISQQLYNQYASLAPTYLSNTLGMVDDSMDGTLGRQMREQAGNNATSTMGAALDANNRNMQRYGMGFNANRLLTENNRNAIMGAAQKAGAMNQASIAAEDQKWNRNAGAYGQIAGMGTGAMSGVGSAAAGYGNMGNAAQAGSMANAQGFGKFGSAIAGIGMGYAKGGEVKCNKFASGAYVRKPFVNHLKPIDWRNMPVTEPGGGNGVGSAIGSVAMGAAPILAAMAVKDLFSKDSKIIGAGKSLFDGAKNIGSGSSGPKSGDSLVDGMVEQDQSASMAAQRSALDGAVENAARDGQSDTSAYGPTTSAFKFDDLSTPKASPSVDGMIKSVTAQNAPIQDGAKVFVDQGEAAAKELARQQAEEEARRIAAEQAAQATQAATSSMDGTYARGGFIKRGVKMATGGFAQQIDSGSFESDPDKFKAKPLTAAEEVAQRAGAGLMAAATNPLTYTRGYDKYQKILAKEAKNKSFVDSKPETPGVAETSPVEAPAQVQEVPLQEQSMSPQQEFSQAFNEATAPEQPAAIESPEATEAPATPDAPAAVDSPAGTETQAPVADASAPAADGTSAVSDGAGAATDGAAATGDAATAAGTATDAASGVADAAGAAGDAAGAAGDAASAVTGAADGASAAADTTGGALDGAGAAVPVIKGVADIAAGRDAGTAVADAAAGYAGAEGGAALGTAVMPGVGTVVGGVLGGVLGGSLFAEGGDVEREDFTPGGDVAGPGTETSDDIPAWLSAGEVVHNADAVKLAGKDEMLAINEAGLAVREGKESPQEAQHKIGQLMIRRGQQLAAGSKFEKRGVKLAGGGYLGVALGAGVDQYNLQSDRAQRKDQFDKAYELQKQNNERMQQVADQQRVEFENKQKDRTDAEALKSNVIGIGNKYQTIGKDADGYIAKEESTNRAAAEAEGREYEPFTNDQKDVLRQSVAKGPEQEYIDAFRGAGHFEAADGFEKKRDLKEVGEQVAGAAKDPVLKAIAKTNPLEAAKLHVGEVNMQNRLDHMERNQALRSQSMLEAVNRKIDARASMGGTKAGSKSGSGTGGEEDNSLSDKDRLAAFNQAIPDEGLPVTDAAGKPTGTLNKATIYAQSNARLSELKKMNPGVDDHTLINTAIEATKFHNGISPNGVVNFKEDGKGGFVPVMTVREATGSREFAIGAPIPYNQIGSLDGEKLKRLNTQLPSKEQVAKAELSYTVASLDEAQKFKAKFESMTPAEIANLPPQVRKSGQNIDLEINRLAAVVSAYAEPAGREGRGIQAPEGFKVEKPAAAPQTTTRATKLVTDAADSTWGSVRDWSNRNSYQGNPDAQKKTRAGFDYWFNEKVPK